MAGKRKNDHDKKLPTRVYRGKAKYEFHPARGGAIALCPLDSPVSLVWAKYEEANKGIADKKLVAGLIGEYFESATFFNLSATSQKDYKKYAKKIIAVFGKMDPDTVKPQHVRKYMDKRGVTAPTQANREKAFFSLFYSWAYERGMVKGNPCKGVRQFKEEARDRYITDEEYQALYSVSPLIVRIAMELAYVCCARQGDVLGLTKQQLLKEGIFIKQGKTGKKQIKAWSPHLLEIIESANALPLVDGVCSLYVIHQPRGQRYTADGFNSRWQKARDAARAAFPELAFDFTFHDLKAKGISDLEGSISDKQKISGHKTASQTARYDRKIEIVPVVGGQ